MKNKLQIQHLNEEGLKALHNKNLDTAISYYQGILQLDANNDNAQHMLSIIFGQQGDTQQAIAAVNRAIQTYSWCADYYNTLAGLQLTTGEHQAALENINRAILYAPDHAGAYNNLGMIQMELGQHQQAVKAYEHSLTITNNEPYVHFNYALALLMLGKWEEGFKHYEWRHTGNELFLTKQPYHYCQVTGTLICIIHEQGFGDTINFCRYASELAVDAESVVIGCPNELVRLMNTCPGVTAKNNINGKWHFLMPMLSLPRLWSQCNHKIPDFKPYLSVPPGDYTHIYEKMSAGKFKIGVVWGSRRDQDINYNIADTPLGLTLLPSNRSLVHYSSYKRSIHPKMYEQIAALTDITLYSLQKGPDVKQLQECNFPIIDLGSDFTDFADTAAAIDKLDLVISIDTAVAHLAGAMGKPVWTLLPYSSEWRWGWNQETTPWYPSMRLFKQQTPGDWPGVMEQVYERIRSDYGR